ncbi:efflux RND transporter permease subunit [Treponema sp. Marseille-Q3903]|nr:efflux RND transporter permease subunit [Treponema sp. Marseille-Q3903]
MEKLITIPLEEKLILINGILEYKSDIQYSKSTTTLYCSKKENVKNIYLAIRNIVDNLYNNLPSDVQKPRIYSSDSNSKSIICIAFPADTQKDSLRDWIELNLKKKLEAVKGVSEVLITGGSQKEILVEFDPEKSAAALQNPSGFATIIQDGNSIYSGTKIRYGNSEDQISFNTKIKTLDEIKQLPVKVADGYTTLGYLADIDFKAKTEDEIVRLNGTDCVSISIKSASDGNSIYISKECKKILEQYEFTGYQYNILYDNGEIQQNLIKDVLISLLESFICIVLILPLFFTRKRTTFLILLLLPVSIIWTIGLLKITSLSVNQYTISGLCIALGLIVDPALVISEICEKSSSKEMFLKNLSALIPSIISASLTSIIVLIPLIFLDNIVSGVKNIALAIIYMVSISLILVIVFFPAFIYSNEKYKKQKFIKNYIERKYIRITYRIVLGAVNKENIESFIFTFAITPIVIFIFSGKSLSL